MLIRGTRIPAAATELSASEAAPAGRIVPDTHRQLVTLVRDRVVASLRSDEDLSDSEMIRRRIADVCTEVVREQGIVLGRSEREELLERAIAEILGYGPLDRLLRDDTITEIMVNGPYQVYIERNGKIERTALTFDNEAHLLRIIERIVAPLGRRIDEASPMVDARLPDGSRINAIIPPLSLVGPALTVRKFYRVPLGVEDLVRLGTCTSEFLDFVRACVRARLNIVISGGTGAGKTTLLNVFSSFLPADERIITIEDAAELQLRQEHVVTLEARPPNLEGKGQITIRQLVINALRMRPDRIIIGEVRGPEALDLLQALNTGHRGSMTTIHANSPLDALSRLETMALTAGVGLPAEAVRRQIERAVDVVVHMERNAEGLRRVREIAVMEREDGGGGRLRSLEPEGPAGLETPARLRYLADPCASNPVQRKREGVKAAATGPRTS